MARPDELTFAPLGGVGEIGMNLSIYGLGNRQQRSFLAVDLGVSFGDEEHLPGIDLIMPDVRFLEKERNNLMGLVLTHAHEDHFGAIIDLWPKLGCKIYATQFSAALFEAKCAAERNPPKIPITVIPSGGRVDIGPFNVEFIPVAHSIPESHALAIHTEVGTVLHTGDWKIDPTPVIGQPTDERRLRELGDEGVLALVGDSTNAVRDGRSPSETEVAATIKKLVKAAKGRVAVTTFASNVARVRAVVDAANAADREVVVVGRAMERVVQVARECGYLDGSHKFRSTDYYGHFPADKVLALCTGSQGEPMAVLSRMANREHAIEIGEGDTVILASSLIPGNENSVFRVINGLMKLGATVVHKGMAKVHVSGHASEGELLYCYNIVEPEFVMPVHGETRHLIANGRIAEKTGVPAENVILAGNGTVVDMTDGLVKVVGEVDCGYVYVDGSSVGEISDSDLKDRRVLGEEGFISIITVVNRQTGSIVSGPDIHARGVAEDEKVFEEIKPKIVRALEEAVQSSKDHTAHQLQQVVRRTVGTWVNRKLRRRPMIIPVVLEA